MYIYFDEHGIIKEVINDEYLRQGSANNNIYAYFKGKPNPEVSDVWFKYYQPSMANSSGVYPRAQITTVLQNQQIPDNPRRDLKYFEYNKNYNFAVIPTSFTVSDVLYNVLSNAVNTELTLYVDNQAYGLIVFNIERSAEGINEIQQDEYINLAQFAYLLQITATKQYVIDAVAVVNNALTTHINDLSNPHSVTKSQVGLGSVINTADSDIPIEDGTTKFTTGGAYTLKNTLEGLISDEENRAKDAEDVLDDKIDGEIDRAMDAEDDLDDKIDTEIADRKSDAGHSIDMTIDSNFDLVVKLLNYNGTVISQDDIDLPLESIVVSATYYDSYTYDGTTYTKVIVIVLATTSVPTIVPVGDLVSGLVSTDELATALSDYVTLATDQNITGEKTFIGDLKFKGSSTTTVGQITTTNYAVKIGYGGVNHITIGGNNLYTNVADYDLGSNSNKWRDLYLSRNLTDGTNSISIANIVAKQDTLVSGTNIKSLNNTSLLGSGNIDYDNALSDSSTNAVQNKVLKGYIDDIGNRLAVLEESIIEDESLQYTYLSDSAIPASANTYPIIESAGMDNTNIKGNSFVYNQLVENGNFESTSGWGTNDAYNSISISGNKATITAIRDYGTTVTPVITRTQNIISGHKTLFIFTAYASTTVSVRVREPFVSSFFNVDNTKTTYFRLSTSASASVEIQAQQLMNGTTIIFENIMVFDLTQSALDSVSTADEAIAELLKRGINVYEYNPYNVGQIRDSKPNALISKSFNVWDEEEFNIGIGVNSTTGESDTTKINWNSSGFVKVIPNTTYMLYVGVNTSRNVFYYDKDKNYIGFTGNVGSPYTFVTPNNCNYIRFEVNKPSYGTTYKHDICINISNATLNGTYRPYKAPISYSLSLPDMRSALAIQDDTSKVRVGVLDLSTANWQTYIYDETGYTKYIELPNLKVVNNQTKINGITDSIYEIIAFDSAGSFSTKTNVIGGALNPLRILIRGNSVDYTPTGILNYELATPTDQPAITLPENIEFEKGGSLEVTYDSTAPTPADFDFEVAVYKPMQ